MSCPGSISAALSCLVYCPREEGGRSAGSFPEQRLVIEPMSCLHVVMKKIYNFPEKSELRKFILPIKLIDSFFSAVTALEMKNFHKSEEAYFLISHACAPM